MTDDYQEIRQWLNDGLTVQMREGHNWVTSTPEEVLAALEKGVGEPRHYRLAKEASAQGAPTPIQLTPQERISELECMLELQQRHNARLVGLLAHQAGAPIEGSPAQPRLSPYISPATLQAVTQVLLGVPVEPSVTLTAEELGHLATIVQKDTVTRLARTEAQPRLLMGDGNIAFNPTSLLLATEPQDGPHKAVYFAEDFASVIAAQQLYIEALENDRALGQRFKDLLEEVSQNFTRDDDLPDELLPRIDEATAEGFGAILPTVPRVVVKATTTEDTADLASGVAADSLLRPFNWTVFNSGGAVVAEDVTLKVVQELLTPQNVALGWTAASVLTLPLRESSAHGM